MRSRGSLAALTLLLWAPLPAAAAETIVAFGDSITRGAKPFDEEDKGGYPARLQRILLDEGRDVEVVNKGVPGETTAAGLSRFGVAIAGADVVVVMEGTNDVDLVRMGLISLESVRANLAGMGSKAKSQGVEAVFSTLIPRGPNAFRDKESETTLELNLAIREIAFLAKHGEAESFEVFREHPRPYSEIYYLGTDLVGHPNSAGFELMARTFADVLQGRDTMHPVIGAVEPDPRLVPSVSPGQPFSLVLYDFGEGLDRHNLLLTLNDVPVETESAGSSRRRLLSHEATNATIPCFARLGVHGLDQADPPNRLDLVVADYARNNATVRGTDLNKDCRVDGKDVLRLAALFGVRKNQFAYDPEVDVNNDAIIDGADLAKVASDFGKSTL